MCYGETKLKFPNNILEAKEYQKEIIKKISLIDSFSKSNIVGSFDVAYKREYAFAACVVYDWNSETVIEEKTLRAKVDFPYIPGYLFLREVPHFLSLLNQIRTIPEIIIIDGHGIAHPRFAGSATVFGVISQIPTIGVAKKPMRYFKYKQTKTKKLEEVYLNEKHVGYRLGFEKKWNPIYVSPGHKISHKTAYLVVKSLQTNKYKLPIPQQLAHCLAAKYKNTF